MKRNGIEDKGPPQKKQRSSLCPSKEDIDSLSNESKEQHIERQFLVDFDTLSNDDQIAR